MPPESIWILPALPALGALANGLLGAAWRDRTVAAVAVGAVGLALAAALALMAEMLTGADDRIFSVTLWRWLTDGTLRIEAGLVLDRLAMVMVMVVLFVGFLIHLYSVDYMRGDAGYRRFFVCLNLFVFFMLVLVLGDNLVVTFVGWEGVGLCSYLLIGFWYEKTPASDAGRKAFIVNRIGDFGFTLAMFLIFVVTGTLEFTGVFAAAEKGDISAGITTWICLLLLTGALGKSAQFPLHVWLPDAMEGPTPVSALIHAATMVNAGVYMVARSYPLFVQSGTAMTVVMAVGIFTAILASYIAITQNDIKKVIAYSTISSLGFMFVALGAGAWVAGVFYLFAHGFFKGLLFLCSGSVIHAMGGEQDMRKMGGLRKKIPVTFWTMLVGALSMVGMIPFAGFWAKDEIVGATFIAGEYVVWVVAMVTVLLTAIYMGRLIFMTFWGETRADAEVQAHIHESPPSMTVPLVILAVPAALLGLVVGLPPEGGWIHGFLEPVFYHPHHAEFRLLGEGGALMLASLLTVIVGLVIAWWLYVRQTEVPARIADRVPWAYRASLNKVYLDDIYAVVPVGATLGFAQWLWDVVDVKVIDGVVNGVAWLWGRIGDGLRPIQTGRVQNYALYMFGGMVVLVAVFAWVWGS